MNLPIRDEPLTRVQLADLGMRTRRAQKLYFNSRRPDDLKMAKVLERKFDDACDEILKAEDG